jgi:integrase
VQNLGDGDGAVQCGGEIDGAARTLRRAACSALVKLIRSDIDFEDKLLRVRGTLARVDGDLIVTSTKTAKSKRSIPVSDGTGALLNEIRKHHLEDQIKAGSQWHQSGYEFTTEDGQPCDPRNALRALKAAATKAGMTRVGLHTLRHSAATAMLTNGVPLNVVSEILGQPRSSSLPTFTGRSPPTYPARLWRP